MLATDRGCGKSRLAAVLRPWALGLLRLRVVLAFGLFLGRDDVPLWALVQSSALGLVLVAGSGVGTLLGDVAFWWRLLWLGAAAALLVL